MANNSDNDLVIANEFSDSVSLIRWNGSDFDAQVTMAVEDQSVAVAIGDVIQSVSDGP